MRRLFLAVLLAFSVGTPAFAAGAKAPGKMPNKVDKALAGELKSGAATHKVIITFKPGYRAAAKAALLNRPGNKIKREHPSLNLLVGEIATADVEALARSKGVKAISLDGPVRAHQAVTVTVSPATVIPGGLITVTVAGGPGNVNDWVGLVEASSPDSNYAAWQYLNGLQTLPLVGVTSATLHFVAPLTEGTYTARLFANGWTKLATSNPVTVQQPTPTVTALSTTVNPGNSITVTVANGPGHVNDWIGLVPADAPDSSYVAWQFFNGAQTRPALNQSSH